RLHPCYALFLGINRQTIREQTPTVARKHRAIAFAMNENSRCPNAVSSAETSDPPTLPAGSDQHLRHIAQSEVHRDRSTHADADDDIGPILLERRTGGLHRGAKPALVEARPHPLPQPTTVARIRQHGPAHDVMPVLFEMVDPRAERSTVATVEIKDLRH